MNVLAEWNGRVYHARVNEDGTAIVSNQSDSVNSEEADLQRFDDDGGAGHG